jgi:hypothetical protein
MHKVPSGSKALRTRFNKVVHYRRDVYDRLGYAIHRRGEAKVVGPGLVIGIPFVHSVMIESVTEQFEPLPPMIRRQPMREFASQINFQVVELEKALVAVADYKGLLVNSCAAVVSTLVKQTALSDEDISVRMLTDDSLQHRAGELGVKLLKLNVSTYNLTEPAQLAHARPTRTGSSSTALRPRWRRGPSTVHPVRTSGSTALIAVDDIDPAA